MNGIRVEVKWQDMWIGAFWRTEPTAAYAVQNAFGPLRNYLECRTDLWVCIVPCLPIHMWWTATR